MNFDKLSDEVLASHIQENSGQGIEELIERYQKPLLRYALRLIGDEDLAEDAVQNTFISAYQNINSYDSRRPFSPWIYRIAHNKAINEIRSLKPHTSLDEALEIPDSKSGESISKNLEQETLKKKLEKFINILSIKYKEPLILRYFEDRTYEEISDILKIPKNTVGVRIKRGLGKLRINIDDKYKEYL